MLLAPQLASQQLAAWLAFQQTQAALGSRSQCMLNLNSFLCIFLDALDFFHFHAAPRRQPPFVCFHPRKKPTAISSGVCSFVCVCRCALTHNCTDKRSVLCCALFPPAASVTTTAEHVFGRPCPILAWNGVVRPASVWVAIGDSSHAMPVGRATTSQYVDRCLFQRRRAARELAPPVWDVQQLLNLTAMLCKLRMLPPSYSMPHVHTFMKSAFQAIEKK